MRAFISNRHISPPANAETLRQQPGVVRQLLDPLLELAGSSDSLIGGSVGEFRAGRKIYRIPRFTFLGPTGGDHPIRLGIFATFHGDEPDGAEALVEFLSELAIAPGAAKDFHLHVYPVCNPGGFAVGSRGNVSGAELAELFWRGSSQPEIYYLEREMGVHRFHGIVSLHTEDNADRFLAHANSSILNLAVAQPALEATRRFLSGTSQVAPENSAALSEALVSVRPGFLTDTDELSPVPFEINLGIPRQAPKPSQIHGTVTALKSILDSYRTVFSLRQNI